MTFTRKSTLDGRNGYTGSLRRQDISSQDLSKIQFQNFGVCSIILIGFRPFGLKTTSEVTSDLIFEISDLNYLC